VKEKARGSVCADNPRYETMMTRYALTQHRRDKLRGEKDDQIGLNLLGGCALAKDGHRRQVGNRSGDAKAEATLAMLKSDTTRTHAMTEPCSWVD
jgi:hypothetical protein